MKTGLQLNSIIPNGLGSSPESAALELIYGFLLEKYHQRFYSTISINQIDDTLEEFISKKGKNIHINIRYPIHQDIYTQSPIIQNTLRLKLIHEAATRIAEFDKKLDIRVLNIIKDEILLKNFKFEFVFKSFLNKNTGYLAEISVAPSIFSFKYFASIKRNTVLTCKRMIYDSLPGAPIDSILYYGKWKEKNKVSFWGKEKEVEITIDLNCNIEIKNFTKYETSPLFDIYRYDITEEMREQAYNNWKESLPPDSIARFYSSDLNMRNK